MKKKKSLVRHILLNHFRLTTIIVSIILVVVFMMLCRISVQNEITETKMKLSQTAQSIRFDMEQNIERANYIAQNEEMVQSFNKAFSDGYELLGFIKSFNMFMTSFEDINYSERDKYIVYLSNPTIMESKYFRNLSRLDIYDDIKNFYEDTGRIFYWSDEINQDVNGNNYMSLFRVIPKDFDCVIEVKTYYEDSIEEIPGIVTEVKHKSQSNHEESFTFSEGLGNEFVLTMRIEKNMLYHRFFIYFMICLLIGTGFLLTALGMAVWSVNRTMRDVLMFVRQVESGELSQDNGDDEVGYEELKVIRRKLVELISQIEAMNRDKYESKLLQNKMEIELLNTKINPHILYNSLSAIKLSAFKTNNTEIDEMLDELIAYYRLVLNRGEELITVGKEFEYLEKYIAVNEMSKKTNYDFNIDVDDDVFDIFVPHMLLQPLVENSIKYGVDVNPCINIKFTSEGENIVFEIADNGSGIEEEKLEKLNHFEDIGYGIKNVMQRLEFYCGNDYSIKFSSNEMGGTTVILKMRKITDH